MRILVTGARSFTGRHLMPLLRTRGDVFGTDIGEASGDDPTYLPANIIDPDAVERVVARAAPDLVVHLAGVSSPDPARCSAVNQEGTRNVLTALKALSKTPRVLFVSSAAVYGRIRPEENPVGEGTPLRPIGPYGESKAAAELLVRDHHRQGVARAVIVRPFNLIGPGLPSGLAPSDFAAEIGRIRRGEGEPVVRTGTLTPRRDFVDVRDAVRAYVLLAETPNAYGQAFNVGSGRPTAIRDLLDRMMALAGVTARVATDPSLVRPVEVEEMVADVRALKKVVRWHPDIALDQSLRDMLQTD
jgi:GDP-4-dehydro-6-deoxy-D-mannose reductase